MIYRRLNINLTQYWSQSCCNNFFDLLLLDIHQVWVQEQGCQLVCRKLFCCLFTTYISMFARQLSDLFQDPVVYKSNSIVLDKSYLGDCCNHDCCCCSRPIAYKSVQISRKKVSYYISMFLVVICIKSNLQSNVFFPHIYQFSLWKIAQNRQF